MTKIPALPNQTAPDGADLLPTEDVSANTTKKMTLTVLKEWFQSLVGWITTAMIGDAQVTYPKLGLASMPNVVIKTITGEPSVTTGNYKVTTFDVVAGVNYLLIATVVWHNSGGSTIKLYSLLADGITIDSHRLEATLQSGGLYMGVYRPTTSGTKTIQMNVGNVSGSGTGTIGATTYMLIPLPSTAAIT